MASAPVRVLKSRWNVLVAGAAIGTCCFLSVDRESPAADRATAARIQRSSYTVLGYNDLGMHCMNQDFSEICILPPFNTLRAQVIRRGSEPSIVQSGVQVRYSIPGNTTSSNKTNFWQYVKPLFGAPVPADVGLTGSKMSGQMSRTGNGDWSVIGIPITPVDDKGVENPFQLSSIQLTDTRGKSLAKTVAVVPVSWEINCNLCHNTPGVSVATDILQKHDKLHGTQLVNQKPVLCASCHADAALNTPGVAGVKSMSHAMHGSHASRMAQLSNLDNSCYACHPGVNTECQRDVHVELGITCVKCHGDMAAVAKPSRRPWIDEPTCGQCHTKINPKFQYEEPGKLFKESKGHGGVFCASCHGPQHAVGPAITAEDNAQAILQQGVAGTISDCTVCHAKKPNERFFHSRDD